MRGMKGDRWRGDVDSAAKWSMAWLVGARPLARVDCAFRVWAISHAMPPRRSLCLVSEISITGFFFPLWESCIGQPFSMSLALLLRSKEHENA
jgi:hypothetical protein